jgi:hypothetical protein
MREIQAVFQIKKWHLSSSLRCRQNKAKRKNNMTKEEKIIKLERMFKRCPEILTPLKASKWTPWGKNHMYELIHSGELRAFTYRAGYMIAKTDLIEYLAEHSDDSAVKHFHINAEGKK